MIRRFKKNYYITVRRLKLWDKLHKNMKYFTQFLPMVLTLLRTWNNEILE
jgi:hypothetical protein